MPEELQTNQPPIETPAASAPPPAASADASTSAVSTPPTADPSGQSAASSPWSFREHLSGRGVNVSGFQDDKTAAEHVIEQYQHAVQQARQLQQQNQQYQMWLAHQMQQSQQPAPPADAKKPWYTPPEWNSSWRMMVKTDEQGNPIPVPGAPPDVVPKYLAARQHQAEFLEKFWQDPVGSIKPGIEPIIEQMIQERLDQRLANYTDTQAAQSLISQSDWMFVKDANGHRQTDFMGQPMLTPAGQIYANNLKALESQGIATGNSPLQHKLATQLTRGQISANYLSSLTAGQQTNQQQKDAFLNGAGHQPGYAGSTLPATNTQVVPPAQNSRLTLGEMLKNDLQLAGQYDSLKEGI